MCYDVCLFEVAVLSLSWAGDTRKVSHQLCSQSALTPDLGFSDGLKSLSARASASHLVVVSVQMDRVPHITLSKQKHESRARTQKLLEAQLDEEN
ncbi:hypothetical protein BKA65DRAFT_494864 [Rhexocercosporidium sp. MPI-PUGE-AT-0058]|nr:hypothetical protein BKA65DRAFT_494864 [Rhexocercosporidium sp. MPI-PUGE-AT-0058]